MAYEIDKQLNNLLNNPKLFLKPSDKLHSTILFQVKKLLDPVIKQSNVFEELYIDKLDSSQIFEEIRLITDELIEKLSKELNFTLENQINFQIQTKYEKENNKRKNDHSLGFVSKNRSNENINLDIYKTDLPLIDNCILNSKEITKNKDFKPNNLFTVNNLNGETDLEEINKLTDEKESLEKTHSFLNLNDIEMDEEYTIQGIENTNEIRYADFFLPSKKKSKHEKLSNVEKITDENSEDNNDFEGSDYSEKIQENIMFNVRQDLFQNNTNKIIENHKMNKSEYMKTCEILSKEIKGFEEENVLKKDWKLMGEVKAKDRSINSLLEEDIEFERATKSVPITTKKSILDLEEMIKKRIIDSNFDEVQKIYPKEKKTFYSSKLLEINDKKNEKSLAEIYEDEYVEKVHNGYMEKKDKITEEHNEIKELFEKAVKKLDSLSNLYYKPKPAKPSLNIISNVSTVIMEETQPSSLSVSTMLAPHEIYVTGSEKNNKEIFKRSGIVIAKEEMTTQEKRKTRKQLISKKKSHKLLLNRANKLNKEIVKTLKKGNVKITQINNKTKNISTQLLKTYKKAKNTTLLKL